MFLKPDVVLEVKNVYKKFARTYKATRKQHLSAMKQVFLKHGEGDKSLKQSEFWAVQDVSFDLKKGETLGIIGLNGSGKSTLLKMINGIFLPDYGHINIEGQVGGLIELGAGFQPNLSGRENIFIKGALIGKSRKEMLELYDDIVEFAEIDSFINTPIKNYSSGMKMRLGFAVAIHIKPDILILDEVLAVGDFRFRQKCLSKINELRENMTTVFVSHSMNDIRLFCDKALVLNKGKPEFLGTPDYAIEFYMSEVEEKKKKPVPKRKDIKPFYGELFTNEDKICDIEHYWADKDLNKIDSAKTGDEVNIVIRFQLKTNPKKELVVGVPIWDKDGTYITGIATDMDNVKLSGDKNYRYEIILNFQELILNLNEYVVVIAVVDGNEYYYTGLNNMLTVKNYTRNPGLVTPSHKWIFKKSR